MAAASAQPIALPTNSNNDFPMNSGSLTGHNGSFNSASYRRFMGSPMSFRAGSFGSRFYPGVSPGQLLGPLDPNDFRFGKMSSSIESDRGSLVNNALNVFERQDELCRDYQCCGVSLTDMHALVNHFEECHVVVVDPFAPQASLQNAPSAANGTQPAVSYFPDVQAPQMVPTYNQGSFDPDDMELDLENTSAPSSGSSSPPDTPISTPLSAYPSAYLQPAPSTTPVSAFDTTTVMPCRSGSSAMSVGFPPNRSSLPLLAPRTEDAFNAYAGYSDYSSLMPGTVGSIPPLCVDDQSKFASPYGARAGCVPPALLLNSNSTSPTDTPDSSRVASPVSGANTYSIQSSGAASSGPSQASTSTAALSQPQVPRASTTLSRPATSLLLSKPFKCPKPNCNKSYKQANGLKYHMTHGSCNFAPPKDLEQIQSLLAAKRSQKEAEGTSEPLSESELREVEKEAERRLRPYACGVGECQRRYKNMNGLRYHYQHSGDHGAIGLALLASGQHECLQHTRSHSRHNTPSNSNVSSAAPSQHPSPLATPAVSQAQPATNYTSATATPALYQSQSPSAYTLHAQQPSPQQHHQQSALQMQYMMPAQR
jgi:transcription factor SFP1